jgi:hypothetical protein
VPDPKLAPELWSAEVSPPQGLELEREFEQVPAFELEQAESGLEPELELDWEA